MISNPFRTQHRKCINYPFFSPHIGFLLPKKTLHKLLLPLFIHEQARDPPKCRQNATVSQEPTAVALPGGDGTDLLRELYLVRAAKRLPCSRAYSFSAQLDESQELAFFDGWRYRSDPRSNRR